MDLKITKFKIIAALFFIGQAIYLQGQAVNHFITEWNTEEGTGQTGNTTIVLPITEGAYDVDINNDGDFDDDNETNRTGSITIDFATLGGAGIYTIAVRPNANNAEGKLKIDHRNTGSTPQKLMSIKKWGDIVWSSMENAFRDCSNMTIANDAGAPNLTMVTNMNTAFQNATSFNSDLNNWNVSKVTQIRLTFDRASSFTSGLSSWDVSNVTDMAGTFQDASSFDGDLSSWNVSNVTDMAGTFFGATNFTSDLSSWDVSNVASMWSTFRGITNFNSDLSTWNVSNVANMFGTFQNATSFNSDLSSWDVSQVTDMNRMFSGANSFSSKNYDALLLGWSALTLQPDIAFTAPPTTYCSGEAGRNILKNAPNNWVIDGDTGAGCPLPFITTWDTQRGTGQNGNNTIVLPISGGAYDVDTNNDGDFDDALDKINLTGTQTITLPSAGTHTIAIRPNIANNTEGKLKIDHSTTGSTPQKLISIKKWGEIVWTSMANAFQNCSNMTLANDAGAPDLTMVTNMSAAFNRATNFNSDLSSWDVSKVTDMRFTFNRATNFNSDLSSWDVSKVTDMRFTFSDAENFTSDLSSWNVSNVQTMSSTFQNAPSFTSDLSNWNVSNVTNMASTFSLATNFNSDLSRWNVSKVIDIAGMFEFTNNFNSDLSSWDVSRVGSGVNPTTMESMLTSANGFSSKNYNALLVGWSSLPSLRENVTFGAPPTTYCVSGQAGRTKLTSPTSSGGYNWTITGDHGLSCPFITTWNTQAGTGQATSITIRLPIVEGTYDIDINNDGDFDDAMDRVNLTGAQTITLPSIGIHTIAIKPSASNANKQLRINHHTTGSTPQKLVSIDQWGDIVWTSMENAFTNCSFMTIADDAGVPNLTEVSNMRSMFLTARTLNSDVSSWDVSNVTDMKNMFSNADSFTSDVSSWDVSKVTNMNRMFRGATNFNSDLSSWNVSNVSDMGFAFFKATSFNSDLSNWDVSNVSDMENMLTDATSFKTPDYDALLTSWSSLSLQPNVVFGAPPTAYCDGKAGRNILTDTHNWTITGDTFSCPFITTWNTEEGTGQTGNTTIKLPITGAYDIDINNDGDFDDTGETNRTDATIDFGTAGIYTIAIRPNPTDNAASELKIDHSAADSTPQKLMRINNWSSIVWTSMENAFQNCSNLTLADNAGVPDLTMVTSMVNMFNGATSFNDDLSSWDVSNVTDMTEMFSGATSFSSENYDALLTGWSSLPSLQDDVLFGAPPTTYCAGKRGRDILTGNHNWTISGDSIDGGCTVTTVAPFVTTWNTEEGDLGNTTIMLPITEGAYDVDIGNDGTFETINKTGSIEIDFITAGTHTIAIRPNAANANNQLHINHTATGSTPLKLTSIDKWGDIVWSSMRSAFLGCSNMTLADDAGVPDLTMVTSMSNAFVNATSFNSDLSSWDVSNVTNMWGTFSYATSFNGNLSSWDVSNVTTMNNTFINAATFNSDLSSWNVSNVTDMNNTFKSANSFNSDLSRWNVSNVTDMNNMLANATSFNNDLSSWDVSNVTSMWNTFNGATSFNSDLSSWNVSKVRLMNSMLTNASSFSRENYDALLTGWSSLPTLQNDVTFGAPPTTYCTGKRGRDVLTVNYNWTISGDTIDSDCIVTTVAPFITTWNTQAGTGQNGNATIVLPISGGAYDVDTNNDGDFDDALDRINLTGTQTITLPSAGTHTIAIRPNAANTNNQLRINHNTTGSTPLKLTSIDKWGEIVWSSMANAFQDCSNMTLANDAGVPDLTMVTSMHRTFESATSFTGGLSSWDVSTVTSMNSTFESATNFTGDLSSWNVSSVTNMQNTFLSATSFNSDLSRWNVSNVILMEATFLGATSFTSDLSRWNVSNVTEMNDTFFNATSFNSDLSSWDVSNVLGMNGMFFGATSFSSKNYNDLLAGWSSLPSLQRRVTFRAPPTTYCDSGQAGRTKLTSPVSNGGYGWTITGDHGLNCPFITTWNPQAGGQTGNTTITLPIVSGAYDVDTNNDGIFDIINNTNPIIDLGTAETHTIAVRPNAANTSRQLQIRFNNSNEAQKLTSINKWSSIVWTSMQAAFFGCRNLTIAEDAGAPDLTMVTDMSFMLKSTGGFNSDLSRWDVSNVTNMEQLFDLAISFNSDLSNWDVSNVANMKRMFENAISFDSDLSRWNVSNVANMSSTFNGAANFTGDLSNWNVSRVTDMTRMLSGAISFSSENYDALLTGWSSLQGLQSGVPFGAPPTAYCDGKAGRDILTSAPRNWIITGDEEFSCPFITTWNTEEGTGQTGNTTIKLPTISGAYDIDINNDGDFDDAGETNRTDATIDFGAAGIYTIAIRPNPTDNAAGELEIDHSATDSTPQKLMSIEKWGDIVWTSMENAFQNCSNMTFADNAGVPDLTMVTNMSFAFNGATSFNVDLSSWNVSNVTNMSSTFSGATSFNVDLSSWNVSNVGDMTATFQNATSFNQDLSSWDVSNVTSMVGTFWGASSFTGDLSNWDVSNVTVMWNTFRGATSFNGDLSSWNVSNATDMTGMFSGATNFSSENYDALLTGWSSLPSLQDDVVFGAPPTTYCAGKRGRDILTGNYSWTISGDNIDGDCIVIPVAPFVTTWNTEEGDSDSTTIMLPISGGAYDIDINNDGDFDDDNEINRTGSIEIDFGTAGTHTIAIRPNAANADNLLRINHAAIGSTPQKLTSIDKWGDIVWSSMLNAFYNCSNMTLADDAGVPDLTNVTNMSSTFSFATSFNSDLSSWDVSNVTNMSSTFNDATNFNGDLSSWDVSQVTNMTEMFSGATNFSSENYDALLTGWSNLQGLQSDVVFGAPPTAYCDGKAGRNILTSTPNNWMISGDKGFNCPFLTTWNTEEGTGQTGNTTIKLPITGAYDIDINNDGDFEDTGETNRTDATIDFGAAGIYTIAIRPNPTDNAAGELRIDHSAADSTPQKLTSIGKWGNIVWTSMLNAFYNCSNMTLADDAGVPDLTMVTNMSNTFFGATSFNSDLSSWNVSNVANMSSTFSDATNFNGDLSSWDVSNVTNMSSTFSDASSFTNDLSSWNVSNVTIMSNTFSGTTSFNSDLNTWNVSQVTDMTGMFSGATSFSSENYNTLLTGWSSLSLQDDVVFGAPPTTYCAGKRGRDILTVNYNWTISGDTIDGGCSITSVAPFVTTWNTEEEDSDSTTIMLPIAEGTYDVDIGGDGTFEMINKTGSIEIDFITAGTHTIAVRPNVANTNNQLRINHAATGSTPQKLTSIDKWGDIVWTSMESAFQDCVNLTIADDAGVPDLTMVTSMVNMFFSATGFNSDLSSWNVSNVTDMTTMLSEATSFSRKNYDALLTGWSSLPTLQSDVVFGAPPTAYCAGKAGRDILTDTHNWTITGDTFSCPFITTWNTEEGTGQTGNTTIKLPITGAYDIDINNDGDFEDDDETKRTDATIDFGTAGIYTIAIRPNPTDNAAGELKIDHSATDSTPQKLISIEKWGDIVWTSMENAFQNCSNITLADNAGVPDLTMVTSTVNMFRDATNFTGDLSNWDVSNITDMENMLTNATSFSSENYDALLTGWSSLPSLQDDVVFGAPPTTYCTGKRGRDVLTGNYNWTISGDSIDGGCSITPVVPFVTTWNTEEGDPDSTTIMLPITGGTYDVDIGGDGTFEMISLTGSIEIDFITAGTHTIAIRPNAANTNNLLRINNAATGSTPKKLTSIKKWGEIVWTSMESAFQNCSNMTLAEDVGIPDLTMVTSMGNMFFGATNFTSNLSSWDVSNVTDMVSTFSDASSFNSDLSNWNVSNVNSMASTFQDATSFDSDLSNWSVSNVTNTESMFLGATSFNSDLSNWSVSNVTNMSFAFNGATSFNSDLSGWNVSNVTSMESTFQNASSFNSDLSNWDVSNITDMENMLTNATSFSSENYDALLTSWSSLPSLQSNIVFGAPPTTYCAGKRGRDILTGNHNWTITGDTIDSGCSITPVAPFVTTWNTEEDDPGSTTIVLPITEGAYDVDIGNDGTFEMINLTGTETITLPSAGTHTIAVRPNAANTNNQLRINHFSLGNTPRKLTSIDKWGEIVWTSMSGAFYICSNMTLADDAGVPDLTMVTSMEGAFWQATRFNSDVSSWDVSNVNNMQNTFRGATNFNGDLSSWDVSNVTNMTRTFTGANNFNRDLSRWNVSKVTSMESTFSNATNFNSDVSNWNVSNVTSMRSIFDRAISFNSDLSNWNVSKVTIMNHMFFACTSFNSDVSTWNVSKVTSMEATFDNATNFNSDISSWNVSNVTSMESTFRRAASFNSDLSSWDVSNVTGMLLMFGRASSFNQDLSSWNVSNVSIMLGMLNNTTSFTSENYNALLTGWSSLPSLQPNVGFGAPPITYCAGKAGRDILTSAPNNWRITGDTFGCEFVTTWNTEAGGQAGSTTIVLPISGGAYDVDINNDGDFDDAGETNRTNTTIDFGTAGIHTIAVRPNAANTNMQLRINHTTVGSTPRKLMTINKWGPIIWTSMQGAFQSCSNMTIANDAGVPNLTIVTSMENMFKDATNFTGNLRNWDVSNVTNMRDTFSNATRFNSDLNNWDVSNVVNMHGTFTSATSFNSNLNSWNVSKVTNMRGTFANATNFNWGLANWKVSNVTNMNSTFRNATNFDGSLLTWDVSKVANMEFMFNGAENFTSDLSNWDVSKVTNMNGAFDGVTNFNSDLSRWNVSKVANMEFMFLDAGNFNSDLSNWNVSQVTSMFNMFTRATSFSVENYDALLTGWSRLPNLQNDVEFGAPPTTYCTGKPGRDILTGTHNWTITGDTFKCSFITTWNTQAGGQTGSTTIVLPILGAYDVDINNDGDFNDAGETNRTNSTINFGTAGMHTITIRPNVANTSKQLRINHAIVGSTPRKLMTINKWGPIIWTSMESAFQSCSNMTIADDAGAPNLSMVTSMVNTFRGATNFTGDLSSWDVSNVTDMQQLFHDANNFNGNLNSWDVSNVTNMQQLFDGANNFNRNLNSWDVSKVANMNGAFQNTNNFNGDLRSWNVSNVTNMNSAFRNATGFNGNLRNWNVSNVTSMSNTFEDATNFNGDLSAWNVSKVTRMTSTFSGATNFNGDLSSWNVSNVVNMSLMFNTTPNFNSDLSRWNVSKVTNMNSTFFRATSFNSDLSSWNVSRVGSSRIGSMDGMLNGANSFSMINYDALLTGWSSLPTLQDGVVFGAPPTTYCNGKPGRDILTGTYNWTITGDTRLDCPLLSLSINAFLQGPYDTSSNMMSDGLRAAGSIPTTSPYGDRATIESTVLDVVTGEESNAIVDWVQVSLHDPTDTSVVIVTVPALLQRNGNVVALDGGDDLTISRIAGNYHVSINHRNHIPVITANLQSLSTTSTVINFTNSTTVRGGSEAMTEVETGLYALFSGDVNGSNQIQVDDYNEAVKTVGSSGYLLSDVNMNGESQVDDINFILKTLGKGMPF